MSLEIQIRSENKSDLGSIHQVVSEAFRNAPHTDHTEQFIVDALRASGNLTLSLVAADSSGIVGHIAVSPVSISDHSRGWYGIGPVSVVPDRQGQGIGSKLMNAALMELRVMGARGCVLLGDPGYYQRFGFKVVDGLVYPGVPEKYFQAVSFADGWPQGTVSYHESFSLQCF